MSSRNYIADGKGERGEVGGLLEFISTDMNRVGIFFWEEEHQSSSLVLVFLSFFLCHFFNSRFGRYLVKTSHRDSERIVLLPVTFFTSMPFFLLAICMQTNRALTGFFCSHLS